MDFYWFRLLHRIFSETVIHRNFLVYGIEITWSYIWYCWIFFFLQSLFYLLLALLYFCGTVIFVIMGAWWLQAQWHPLNLVSKPFVLLFPQKIEFEILFFVVVIVKMHTHTNVRARRFRFFLSVFRRQLGNLDRIVWEDNPNGLIMLPQSMAYMRRTMPCRMDLSTLKSFVLSEFKHWNEGAEVLLSIAWISFFISWVSADIIRWTICCYGPCTIRRYLSSVLIFCCRKKIVMSRKTIYCLLLMKVRWVDDDLFFKKLINDDNTFLLTIFCYSIRFLL